MREKTRGEWSKQLDFFAVLWIVLSSGSMFFGQLNTNLSMFGLGIIIVLYLITYRYRCERKNVIRYCFVLLFFVANICITGIENNSIKDGIIFLIRISAVFIIQSCVEQISFVKNFIKVIYIISIVSLVCWSIGVVFPDFPYPGTFEVRNENCSFYGTFYYTIGMNSNSRFGSEIGRNAGIFWEPGVFQVYLNMAFFLAMCYNKVNIKNRLMKAIILAVTLATTQSSMGYLILMIQILFIFFSDNDLVKKYHLKKYVFFALVIGGLIVFIEGSLIEKLLYGGGSFITRYDDAIVVLQTIVRYPIWGIGSFSDLTAYVVAHFTDSPYRRGRTEITCSNGLLNVFATHGIPAGMIYVWCIFKSASHFFVSKKEAIMYWVIVLMCLANEPIAITSFFVCFLFNWKELRNTRYMS